MFWGWKQQSSEMWPSDCPRWAAREKQVKGQVVVVSLSSEKQKGKRKASGFRDSWLVDPAARKMCTTFVLYSKICENL
jgi:hypothetical protein